MIELLEQRAQDDPMLAGTRVMLEDLRERGHGLYLGFAGLKNSVL